MTRALIADPELPRKAREGRLSQVVRCIGCNACIAHYHAGTALRCAVNPRTGRELKLGPPAALGGTRRVVVVGGGPAGVAAAIEAGRAGHEVVLLEQSDHLGGQIALAGAAPGGRELARAFLEDAERRLAEAAVDVRLGAAGPGRARGRRLRAGHRSRPGPARRAASRPGTFSPARCPKGRASSSWTGEET